MKRIWTYQVIALLRKRLRNRTKTALAAELGISPQYLNDVLLYNRAPGDKMLHALGLKREVLYVRKDDK